MLKNKNYEAVYQAMRYDKIPSPGKTATILLDAFTIGNNKIYAEQFKAAKITGFKNFTEWRAFLCSKNWLSFEMFDEKYTIYSPGSRLAKYVTKEKEASGAMASFKDVQAVTLELERTREDLNEAKTKLDNVESKADSVEERLSLMEKVVKSLIEELDPPYTKEKEAKHLAIVKTQN